MNFQEENALQLSDEQKEFIKQALEGKNILVDACIGSGKTTTIQFLCDEIPKEKQVLYLTYNKILKLDAQLKIKEKNITVTNYHSFAQIALKRQGVHVGVSDLIQRFNHDKPPIRKYDVLILDEYQDIETEFAELLNYIKAVNKSIQIIAVGDMNQKIYDKTSLNVETFIADFLGDYIQLQFTQCFRLSSELAGMLGKVWGKKIIGVNENCKVEIMQLQDVVSYLADQNPRDILCLGKREGDLSETLNLLEENWPEKFNKNTVYASIADKNTTGATSPKKDSAIFTTYDSSKGLERKVCVIFDFTEEYWTLRMGIPQQKYEILRNIFCVAASRGKERIIFVNNEKKLLTEEMLSFNMDKNEEFKQLFISDMFFFKYKEDVEECYRLLSIKRIEEETLPELTIKNSDGLIDLSPCIGIFQEAAFFEKYDINRQIEFALLNRENKRFMFTDAVKNASVREKVLFLTALETHQDRYWVQVKKDFIKKEEQLALCERLQTVFSKDETVQEIGKIEFGQENGERWFSAIGMADVIKDNTVYELKYVTELMHEHFLQCACYMVAFGLKRGVIWNTRNNIKYQISIPDEKLFLDAVSRVITKGVCREYFKPKTHNQFAPEHTSCKMFAVVDTETNWKDEVMSIGITMANQDTFCVESERYYILSPEDKVGGMYASQLKIESVSPIQCSRKEAIQDIKLYFKKFNVEKIFAYNAKFDLRHLPELSDFSWYDIMRVAAYKQYNNKIPATAELYKTGKLKKNYGVESILRLLKGDGRYSETHNALLDARDELEIMKLLGHKIEIYSCANINKGNKTKEKALPKVKPAQLRDEKGGATEKKQNEKVIDIEEKETHADGQINSNEKYYTVAEVAQILNLSKSTVYKRLHEGEIAFTHKDGVYAVKEEDLKQYIESMEKAKAIGLLVIVGMFFVLACIFLVMLQPH